MSRPKPLAPATSTKLMEEFRSRLNKSLARLSRREAASLLRDLDEVISYHSRVIQSVEDGRQGLLAKASQADGYTELKEIENVLVAMETAYFVTSGSVTGLHQGCTEYRDRLAERTLTLVEEEMAGKHGPAPLPYALISMGSDGRAEQTLITDQDYLIVYGNGGSSSEDAYFQLFSELLVERLAEVGFAKCTGNIMPSNPTWRGSLSQWEQRLLAIVQYEYEGYAANLMNLIVLSDARFVAGDATIAKQLINMIYDFEHNSIQVLLGMVRQAVEMKVGLGLFGQLWVDRAGDHRGLFNIKLLGWAPLIMNVRILAINKRLPVTNTLQRIAQLEQCKQLDGSIAEELCEAYHTLTRHRIKAQIRFLRREQLDSYFIDPEGLSPAEHEELRQALGCIKNLQNVIRTNFSPL